MYAPIDGTQTGIIALSAFAFAGAYIADAYFTSVGLTAGGDVERNPLNKWLFGKVGFSLTVFIELGASLILGAAISDLGWQFATAFYGVAAAGEAIYAILNYRLLKAQKTSLK